MDRYLRNPLLHARIPQTSRGRSTERSNLSKGLSVPGMTLPNFLRGLQVLAPDSAKWTFTLNYADREVTTVVELSREAIFQDYHNLHHPDRKNPLAIAWDALKAQVVTTPAIWRDLFNAYLANPENGVIRVDGDSDNRNSEKGNLTKALTVPNMTIKVFTKGIRILNPVSITTELELNIQGGRRITKHTVTVITSQLSMLEMADNY